MCPFGLTKTCCFVGCSWSRLDCAGFLVVVSTVIMLCGKTFRLIFMAKGSGEKLFLLLPVDTVYWVKRWLCIDLAISGSDVVFLNFRLTMDTDFWDVGDGTLGLTLVCLRGYLTCTKRCAEICELCLLKAFEATCFMIFLRILFYWEHRCSKAFYFWRTYWGETLFRIALGFNPPPPYTECMCRWLSAAGLGEMCLFWELLDLGCCSCKPYCWNFES